MLSSRVVGFWVKYSVLSITMYPKKLNCGRQTFQYNKYQLAKNGNKAYSWNII